MLDRISITQIFSKIALSHNAKPHQRINTVALCDFISDINLDALNRTYAHVGEGTYWRRKKMSRSDISKDYGLWMIIPDIYDWEDLNYGSVNIGFQLISGFPIICKDCPKEYNPTTTQLDKLNQDILMSFIDQFGQFTKYDVDISGNTETIFDHPDNEGSYTIERKYGSLLDSGIIEPNKTLRFDNFTVGVDQVRCSKTNIMIRDCHSAGQQFDYSQTQGGNKQILVKCETCF